MKYTISNALFALLVLTSSNGFAQTFRYGITAGLQLSHPKDLRSRTGFHVGAKGELDFRESESKAYLDFGVLLSAKGWIDDLTDITMTEQIDWKCRLYYLEVPVYIGYKYAVNDRMKLLASIGPYFAIGLSGKSEFDGGSSDVENFYSGNLFNKGAYKRFDFGFGAKIGVETSKHFQVAVGYEMSLIKPTKGMWNALSTKDRTCSISFTYLF